MSGRGAGSQRGAGRLGAGARSQRCAAEQGRRCNRAYCGLYTRRKGPWYNPVFEAYSAFIGRPQQVALDTLLPAPEFGRITLHGPLDQATLKRLVHLVYDVRRDDALLRKVAGIRGV